MASGQKKSAAASSNGEAASARTDGDALRAARLEGLEEREWVLFGKTWKLKPEVPFSFAETWVLDRGAAIASLFVDPADGDEFLAQGPSDPDVAEIIKSYKLSEGKSSASSRS